MEQLLLKTVCVSKWPLVKVKTGIIVRYSGSYTITLAMAFS